MSEYITETNTTENRNNNEILSTTNDQDYIVNITELKKYYGPVKAVNGIDLKIAKGSIFGFLGPNGAGKTTTINCLLTLLRPTNGSGIIAGFDMYDISHIRSKVAGVFQEQTLDEQLSGYQNLDLHARLYHLPKKIRKVRIAELAASVGLSERLHDPVIKYSGGMRRRLEIARGLLTEPEILFLDEPTIGLDPQSRSHIWDKLKEMNKKKNITIFITTHHMDEAEALCDQIAIIDKGKIVIIGSSEELKSSLAHDIIALQIKYPKNIDECVTRLNTIPEIESIKIVDNVINIGTKNGPELVATIAQKLDNGNNTSTISIHSIEIKKPSLNDVFMHYTGKNFRDQDEISLSERLTIRGRKSRNRAGFRR